MSVQLFEEKRISIFRLSHGMEGFGASFRSALRQVDRTQAGRSRFLSPHLLCRQPAPPLAHDGG
ncbi:hypothetical protein A0J57_13565 [Sphingobium sp. 22B]|nr:hypothetical protein A0J57_13565 [Sphingobium sp. 22B]OAP31359.1 hypothetical protein A8O16_13670 [Sphingobium sp. 20006FA]